METRGWWSVGGDKVVVVSKGDYNFSHQNDLKSFFIEHESQQRVIL